MIRRSNVSLGKNEGRWGLKVFSSQTASKKPLLYLQAQVWEEFCNIWEPSSFVIIFPLKMYNLFIKGGKNESLLKSHRAAN